MLQIPIKLRQILRLRAINRMTGNITGINYERGFAGVGQLYGGGQAVVTGEVGGVADVGVGELD